MLISKWNLPVHFPSLFLHISAFELGGSEHVLIDNLYRMIPSFMDCPGGSDGKESACNAGNPGSVPGSGRSLGEGNGYHCSILAWRIPWTEEPGGLQFGIPRRL